MSDFLQPHESQKLPLYSYSRSQSFHCVLIAACLWTPPHPDFFFFSANVHPALEFVHLPCIVWLLQFLQDNYQVELVWLTRQAVQHLLSNSRPSVRTYASFLGTAGFEFVAPGLTEAMTVWVKYWRAKSVDAYLTARAGRGQLHSQAADSYSRARGLAPSNSISPPLGFFF